jgi:hypothetical protein
MPAAGFTVIYFFADPSGICFAAYEYNPAIHFIESADWFFIVGLSPTMKKMKNLCALCVWFIYVKNYF